MKRDDLIELINKIELPFGIEMPSDDDIYRGYIWVPKSSITEFLENNFNSKSETKYELIIGPVSALFVKRSEYLEEKKYENLQTVL